MCTAFNFQTKAHYFGRNLDLDCSYGEEVCVLPWKFPLVFRACSRVEEHYAIIGMATVVNGVPLFYDGVNEHGLCMAGLNFPNNAAYFPLQEGKENVAPFEFIPWILGQCRSVSEAKERLAHVNLVNLPFSESLPLAPLHWIISDGKESVTVEPMKDGVKVLDNPVGVLTNNPPFDYHLRNLNNYRNLRTDNGEKGFAQGVALEEYCQGLGAIGLPGDLSSPSRFIRATFHKCNSVCEEDENASVSQCFHLLSSVEMLQGSCRTSSDKYDITVYSCCMNADRGLYYYTTYNNRQIACVDMHGTNLNGKEFSRFPLKLQGEIYYQNK